jgi:hypothetical protein
VYVQEVVWEVGVGRCVSWAGGGLGRGGKVDQVGSSTHLGEEVGITHSCLCLASDVERWRDQASQLFGAVKSMVLRRESAPVNKWSRCWSW